MDIHKATEILGSMRGDEPVWLALRAFIEDVATKNKQALYGNEFTDKVWAAGKTVGILEFAEYIRGLPATCAAQRAAEKEKQP